MRNTSTKPNAISKQRECRFDSECDVYFFPLLLFFLQIFYAFLIPCGTGKKKSKNIYMSTFLFFLIQLLFSIVSVYYFVCSHSGHQYKMNFTLKFNRFVGTTDFKLLAHFFLRSVRLRFLFSAVSIQVKMAKKINTQAEVEKWRMNYFFHVKIENAMMLT